MRRGAWAWFHGVSTCGAKFLNIDDFFIERQIKLWLKISEELECAFGVIGKILMSRI
jgi:hypothetical protein